MSNDTYVIAYCMNMKRRLVSDRHLEVFRSIPWSAVTAPLSAVFQKGLSMRKTASFETVALVELDFLMSASSGGRNFCGHEYFVPEGGVVKNFDDFLGIGLCRLAAPRTFNED